MQIDKNIPLPPAPNAKGRGKFVTILKEMKDGDSVLITDKREVANMMITASNMIKSGKFSAARRFTQRKVEGGWRVWCLIEPTTGDNQ